MSEAVRTVQEAEGGIDALVNNAGYSQNGAVESDPARLGPGRSSRPTSSG